jgi:hypothetical protein
MLKVFQFQFFGGVKFKNVLIRDQERDTLIYSDVLLPLFLKAKNAEWRSYFLIIWMFTVTFNLKHTRVKRARWISLLNHLRLENVPENF